METGKLKNMIVLKNLPSNLIEEAIVIVKPNKKIKSLKKIENIKKYSIESNITNKNDYVLSEAENVITSYLKEIEKKEINFVKNNAKEKKYKRLKKYACIASIIILIQGIILIFR